MDRIFQFDPEESFKDLFDNAHDLIHVVHIDGSIIYANKAWTKLLEYELQQVIDKSIYSFIDPADRERFTQFRQSIINGDTNPNGITVNFLSRNGKKITVEGNISLKQKNDKPLYTRGIFRDITQKLQQEEQLKRYTEELKDREDNLQRLLMNAPDGVIVINQESKITFWNEKAEKIFGWRQAEVMGASLAEKIIPHRYREAHAQGMKRFLTTGEARVLNKTIEITALNKAEEEFYVSLTISTTYQKQNIAFIAFIRDITEQKKNQLELEKKTKELERSNQKLEQFAHVASHDMKEPIRKIKLFNELVKSNHGHLLPEVANTYLDKVQKAADRLLNMVEGVLKYSTVETHTAPHEEIDLHAILQNIATDLEVVIREKKAELHYGDFPKFRGIPFLITQLFYNLINNSLKFIKDDVLPVIEISGREIHSPDNVSMVELIVKDNGIGFRPENAEKIFDTFTRLNTQEQFEGTGLGLALCKEIVERHNGTIRAEGTEGVGATFIIHLPQKAH